MADNKSSRGSGFVSTAAAVLVILAASLAGASEGGVPDFVRDAKRAVGIEDAHPGVPSDPESSASPSEDPSTGNASKAGPHADPRQGQHGNGASNDPSGGNGKGRFGDPNPHGNDSKGHQGANGSHHGNSDHVGGGIKGGGDHGPPDNPGNTSGGPPADRGGGGSDHPSHGPVSEQADHASHNNGQGGKNG